MTENITKTMKKTCSINLDKLLEDYLKLEKKFSDINGKNNLLEIQLEKLSRMWQFSQTKELAAKEDHAALQNIIKVLQETVEAQCNMRDENSNLKKKISIIEEILEDNKQECKTKVEMLVSEMKAKEEEYNLQIKKIQCEMEAKVKLIEEEQNCLLSKKDAKITELSNLLRNQEKEKQSELIKQQIEFNAKLARIQNKTAKMYPNADTLSQNIYRTKLQHLKEEKNKEIESLRNTIRDLERQLVIGQDSRLKRRRF